MVRRELLDGAVVTWPAPSARHQGAVANLVAALRQHCPRTLAVLPGPLDFQPAAARSFQPDVIVTRRMHLGAAPPLTMPPVLLAEVIDEASEVWDRSVKRALYAASRVDHYWHFDPAVPEFVAYRLAGEEYVEVVTARGEERVGFESPVLVEICPARLRF